MVLLIGLFAGGGPGEGDSGLGPGLLGFVVFAGLVVAVVLLYRSMRKQLRRIDFEKPGESDDERSRRRPDDSGS